MKSPAALSALRCLSFPPRRSATLALCIGLALGGADVPTLYAKEMPAPEEMQAGRQGMQESLRLMREEMGKLDTETRKQVVQLMANPLIGGLKSVQASPVGEALDEAGVFTCPEQRATPSVIPPTRPLFVKLLDQLKHEYGRKAGDRQVAVDKALAKAKTDAAGTNLTLPLTLTGNAPAAVVAAVWSCARKPDNATFASNLGSLLDGVGDARAAAVLAYALSLTPDNILPNANQGWYFFNRGQLAKAKASFEKAAKREPNLGPVLHGQGLVAHCQGDHRRAIEILTRALSVSSSRAGEQALSESRAKETEHENQDEDEKKKPKHPSPDDGPTPPRRDDWTKGARKPRVVFAEPVVPSSNVEHLASGMARNAAIVEGYRLAAEALIARQQALNPNAGGDRAPVRTTTSVTFYRGDDAMVALARAQYTAYAARIRTVRAPFERAFGDQREGLDKKIESIQKQAMAAGEKYMLVFCEAIVPLMEGEYGKFRASWRGAWEAEQKVIREYGETAGATIAQIRHDDLRKYLDIERQLHLMTMAMDGPADIAGWGSVGGAIMNCDPAGPPLPGTEVQPPEEATQAPCPPFLQNGIGVNLGVASVSLDCEKIAFQAGEGLIGRFEQNYVKHEQTYYLGVGVEATAGAGSLSAGIGGSAGVFVTCSGNTVRDVGVQGSSSASVPGFSAETSGTVAVVSGASSSFSASAGGIGLPGAD